MKAKPKKQPSTKCTKQHPNKKAEEHRRREQPIIFTAESVRAILEGRKSQTRRLAKFVPFDDVNLSFSGLSVGHYCTGAPELGWCLYSTGECGIWNQRSGRLFSRFLAGDRLWVKEVWGAADRFYVAGDRGIVSYRADRSSTQFAVDPPRKMPNHDIDGWDWNLVRWHSPICMPRWASRILREVTEVRVQCVQEISEEDAVAEGFTGSEVETPREQFAAAWGLINGRKAPWSSNPFVFAYTFRRIEP